ncbi:nitroreductase family protein [Caballeronia sp. DA-9]|uniref:nitroreductase family protein n=1 Tax=Caballeronia sp. DA-9 TaxID=3436237 RepID=UPI003F66F482
MSTEQFRTTHHPTEPVFVSRWSTRSLSGERIPDSVLFSCFEAARWAPSGGNAQPWRFIYAKRESPHWDRLYPLLNEKNQEWAALASTLVLVLSRKTRDSPEGKRPLRSHSFDAGAAWSNFAHQASLLGWTTRAIGGFQYERTRAALKIPDDYEIEIFIALGKASNRAALSPDLQASDRPSSRLPVTELVCDGHFGFP